MLQENQYSSKLLNNAVAEFSKLPGIGNKTALRLVLHLLKKSEEEVNLFGETIIELRKNIKKCKICKNVSDNEICEICADASRDQKTVCLVENINDVIAVERTGQYKGLYHVLGGLISPMDGIGPDNLEINSLIDRIKQFDTEEIIFALNATPEGETTNFYTYKKVSDLGVKITTLAKGVSIGSELQYVDELTLGRSILDRINFSQ
ncbi:MAG: recombination mediator RecR [Bacteroidales bacterium]|nr:recombination mediator RecR [Bacteroidales bacterium]